MLFMNHLLAVMKMHALLHWNVSSLNGGSLIPISLIHRFIKSTLDWIWLSGFVHPSPFLKPISYY